MILDLPLGRVRQMVTVIAARRRREKKHEIQVMLRVAQAHVQHLGQLLPGLAQSKQAARAISKAVSKIDFTLDKKERKKEIPQTSSVLAMMGVSRDGQAGVK